MVPCRLALLSKLLIKNQSHGHLQILSWKLQRSLYRAYSWDILKQQVSTSSVGVEGGGAGLSFLCLSKSCHDLPIIRAWCQRRCFEMSTPASQLLDGDVGCSCRIGMLRWGMWTKYWGSSKDLRTQRKTEQPSSPHQSNLEKNFTRSSISMTWSKRKDLLCPTLLFISVQGAAHPLGSCEPILSMPNSSRAKCTCECQKIFQHPTCLLLWELLPTGERSLAGKEFSCSNSKAEKTKQSLCQPPASHRHNFWSSWNHQPSVLGIWTQTLTAQRTCHENSRERGISFL